MHFNVLPIKFQNTLINYYYHLKLLCIIILDTKMFIKENVSSKNA